jgi:hypothetical protein
VALQADVDQVGADDSVVGDPAAVGAEVPTRKVVRTRELDREGGIGAAPVDRNRLAVGCRRIVARLVPLRVQVGTVGAS